MLCRHVLWEALLPAATLPTRTITLWRKFDGLNLRSFSVKLRGVCVVLPIYEFKWHLFGYISSRFHSAFLRRAVKSNCSNGAYQTDARVYSSVLTTDLSDAGWNASVAKKTSLSFAKLRIRLEIWSPIAPRPTRLCDFKVKM